MPTRRGYVFVLLAAALWGTTGTAQALGPETSNPLTVGALRMVVGGVGLAVVGASSHHLHSGTWLRPPVIAGGIAMATYQPLFFAGVARTGVAAGTLVALGTAPLLAGLGARLLRGEAATPRWIVSTAFASIGLVLLVVAGNRPAVEPLGFLAAVGAGSAYAVYAVAAKDVIERSGPTTAMTLTFGWAALLSTPLLAFGNVAWVIDEGGLRMVLYLGLITTTLAYLLFARGLAISPVGTTTTLTLVEPTVAALLGVLVLGEQLDALSWAGLGLLVAALANLSRAGS